MRMARMSWLGLALAVGVAGLPAGATSVENWTSKYPLAAGGRVSVSNVQGSIEVEAWDRAEVELTVQKSTPGERAGLAAVEVEIESGADWFRVQTRYPGDLEEPVTVNYRLRVPRQVGLVELRSVNGNIAIREVEGPLAARTLNGHIEVAGATGSVAARSVNGSVQVALRALPELVGSLELETINGDLRLLLPPTADVALEMSTVAGRIESGLLFEARGAPGDTTLRARLGRGRIPARLRTLRGNIYLGDSEDIL